MIADTRLTGEVVQYTWVSLSRGRHKELVHRDPIILSLQRYLCDTTSPLTTKMTESTRSYRHAQKCYCPAVINMRKNEQDLTERMKR